MAVWIAASDFISLHYVQERAQSYATTDKLARSLMNFAGAQALAFETLAQQFRLHPRRGIWYLFGNKQLRKIDDLISLAVAAA